MTQDRIMEIVVDGFQWMLIGAFVLFSLFLIAYIYKQKKALKQERLEKEIMKKVHENGKQWKQPTL